MQIFNFDPPTGRYLGAGQADPDPMRPGEWLLPAFSTPKEPPSVPAGHVAVFDRLADAWGVQELPAMPAPDDTDPATPRGAARAHRDLLLRASDWVVLRAYESGEPVPATWATYRQALRDLPAQEDFPDSVNWPEAPAA